MKAVSLVMLPLTFVSFSVASSVDSIIPNAKKNPLLTINAGTGGKFATGYNVKTVTVRNGITWGEYKNNMPKPTKSGYDIEKWCFANDSQAAAITDDFEFTTNTTIYAIWGPGEVKHFATDSWATIIDLADKGIDKLKEAYEEDLASYGNTFVITNANNDTEVALKTRKLELSGIGTYNVRVIGEGVDKIDGVNEVATLTFEFEELIAPSVSYSNVTTNQNAYKDSDLRNFLNNSFYQRLPSVVRDNLKTIEKTTNDGLAKTTTSVTKDKVFALSLNEMGINDVNESSIKKDSAFENNRYYYYDRNNSIDSETGKCYTKIKYYNNPNTGTKEALSYWTRSPYLSNSNKAHTIDSNGLASDISDTLVTRGNAVAPCFAVGKTAAKAATVNNGTHITDSRYNSYIGVNTNFYAYFKTESSYVLPTSDDTENLKVYVDDVLLVNEEGGAIKYFSNPNTGTIVVNDQYVTGNIRIEVNGVSDS